MTADLQFSGSIESNVRAEASNEYFLELGFNAGDHPLSRHTFQSAEEREMNISRLHALGWQAKTGLRDSLAVAYRGCLAA